MAMSIIRFQHLINPMFCLFAVSRKTIFALEQTDGQTPLCAVIAAKSRMCEYPRRIFAITEFNPAAIDGIPEPVLGFRIAFVCMNPLDDAFNDFVARIFSAPVLYFFQKRSI